MVETARKWYSEHQEKTPLEKVSHRPTMPAALTEPQIPEAGETSNGFAHGRHTRQPAGGGHSGEGGEHYCSAWQIDDKLSTWRVE